MTGPKAAVGGMLFALSMGLVATISQGNIIDAAVFICAALAVCAVFNAVQAWRRARFGYVAVGMTLTAVSLAVVAAALKQGWLPSENPPSALLAVLGVLAVAAPVCLHLQSRATPAAWREWKMGGDWSLLGVLSGEHIPDVSESTKEATAPKDAPSTS